MVLLISGLIISFLLGSALASFVHCWAHRLYSGQGFKRRSHCPKCGQQLTWLENIPIFSYLRLAGRCRHCRQPIPSDYLWSELAGGLLLASALITAWFKLGGDEGLWLMINNYQGWLMAGQALIGFILLMLVFLTDYWWLSIFTGPIMVGSVILAGFRLLSGADWTSLLMGGLFGGLFFAVQFWLSRGRWVGEGDIYLGVFLGVWLGWPLIVPTIFAAYIVGAIIGLFLLISGQKDRTAKLPMGVFLAPSGWLFFLWGQLLWQTYLVWLGW